MKLLIISDIHSNADGLEEVLRRESDADKIYCAGDLVDYGCFACEVIERVRSLGITTVYGNHDSDTVKMIDHGIPQHDMTTPYNFFDYERLTYTEKDLDYLRRLPKSVYFEADGMEFFMKHYRKDSDEDICTCRDTYIKYWEEHVGHFAPSKKHFLITGHTHRPLFCKLSENMCWLNPGSLSHRRNGESQKPMDYATIEDGEVTLKTAYYDTKRNYEAIMSRNFNEDCKKYAEFAYKF